MDAEGLMSETIDYFGSTLAVIFLLAAYSVCIAFFSRWLDIRRMRTAQSENAKRAH